MNNTYFKHLVNYLRPFLAILLCFVCSILVLKIYDTVRIICYEHVGFTIVLRSLVYFAISTAVFAVAAFIVYAVLRLFSAKLSNIVTSLIFGLILLLEISLSIYSAQSGALMGIDLFQRPISEILQTVISVLNPWLIIFIILFVVAGFAVVAVWVSKLKIHSAVLFVILIANILSLPFIGAISLLTDGIIKPNIENYIVSKTYYCFSSYIEYVNQNQNRRNFADYEEYDEYDDDVFVDEAEMYSASEIQKFLNENDGWVVPDEKYPLEREYDSVSVLSPYFTKSNQKPNVVLIIVESLGRDWSGYTELGVSFTPFIDSLSEHSLYWKNCLSVSPRSFGAVPALTGSLPYGPKGFQFGRMPDNNSVISILQNDGYGANAFYASDFSFDCIYEYLQKERVDYMSTRFRAESFAQKRPEMVTYWGYHDKYMFKRSLEVLEEMAPVNPQFNLFVTISAHDEINIKSDEQQYFIDRTNDIIKKIDDKNKRNIAKKNMKHEASIYYTDCALRYFFEGYSKRPDYKNTIFIITGDHALGIDSKNRLAYYHVPLIIYSPLLNAPTKFPSVVSHNDVAPSIISLLVSNYGLAAPKYVQWVGSDLDTSSSFKSNRRILFMNYEHEINEMLYHDIFYWKQKDAVYSIDEDLNMIPNNDSEIKQEIKDKMELYKYVNNYVYLSNRLTKNPLHKGDIFVKNSAFSIDSMSCTSLKEKPSEKPPVTYPIVADEEISQGCLSKVRICMSAEVLIEGTLYQDKQMELVFKCDGQNMVAPKIYKDKIVKFLDQESIEENKWYKLRVIKDFNVLGAKKIRTSVYIQTQEKDIYWTPNNTLFIRNIEVNIAECKAN